MDVSELREKPAGRQPIETRTISMSRLDEVTDGVGRALQAGKLVYWICPLVEESEAEGTEHLTNATERFETLRQRFGDRVGLVHGQMKGTEKDRVMAQFAAHESASWWRPRWSSRRRRPGRDYHGDRERRTLRARQLHQFAADRAWLGGSPACCSTGAAGEMSGAAQDPRDHRRPDRRRTKLRGEGDVLGIRQAACPATASPARVRPLSRRRATKRCAS
jgi:ATP-dependent DNA helicase RecG